MIALLLGLLSALDARDDLKQAIQALRQAENYRWSAESKTQDRDDPELQFRMGPIRGSTRKDGLTHLETELVHQNEKQPLEGAYKGDQRFFKTAHFDWMPAAQGGGKGYGSTFEFYFKALTGHIVQNSRRPSEEAEVLLSSIVDVKDEGGGVYSGELSEKTVEDLAQRGPGRSPNADGKGSARFWVQEGRLRKYEYRLTGKRDYRRVAVDRTTTVEISKVGETVVELPAKARELLQGP